MKHMWCVVMALTLTGVAVAQETVYPDGVRVSALPNGLTVAVKEYPAVPGVSVRIYVKVGSALEEDLLGCGVSHYCEHLVAGCSTTKRSEDELDRAIQLIGAQENAYTTTDHTCYHSYCASEHWKTALEILAEHVMHCAMDPGELERERGVITREINMGEDEPRRVIHKLLMGTVFPNSPLGLPTIGFRDNFLSLTPDQVVDFYRRHYVPNNAIVVIVGDIDATDALATVERVMGDWPRGSLFRVPLMEEPPQVGERRAQKGFPGEVAYLRIAWPGTRLTDPDLYALDLLAGVLGDGASSRLGSSIKEARRLAYEIGAYSSTPAIAPGPFVVTATVPADKVNDAVEAILAEIEIVRNRLVSREELQRAQTQVIAGYRFGQQACENMAAQIGGDLLHTGDPTFSARYADRMAEVTAEQVRDAARRYLAPDRVSIVCLGGEPLRAASGQEASREAPSIGSTTLPNGLRVVTRSNPQVGVVSIEALFLGGNRHETEENNGLFTLLSQLLTKGTKRRSAAQIAQLVESRGGTIEAGSGKETFWLRLDLLASDLDFGMALLGELLTESTFPAEEVEKAKKEALAKLQKQENDWQAEAFTFFLSTYFAGHPYGLNSIGRRDAILATTREHLIAAHGAHVRAGSAVVAVCGGVTPDEVAATARRHLGKVPPGSCPEPPAAPLPSRPHVERAVKVNEKAQVTLCRGYPAPRFGDPDEYPIRLMDAVTSGINLPQGWLHDALRGRNDLVYFVHLMPILYREAGVLVVMTQCQPDHVDTVLALIDREMERARAGDFTEEDIEAAKGEYITAVDNGTQTTADQAYRLASFELFGIGREVAFSFADRVRAVTVPDVQRVAGEYLNGGVLTLAGPRGDGAEGR